MGWVPREREVRSLAAGVSGDDTGSNSGGKGPSCQTKVPQVQSIDKARERGFSKGCCEGGWNCRIESVWLGLIP